MQHRYKAEFAATGIALFYCQPLSSFYKPAFAGRRRMTKADSF
jgi:hypothetical protein